MKTIGLMLLLAVSSVLGTWSIYQCCLTGVKADVKLTTTNFQVTGMTCGGCEAAVRMAIQRLDGITEATASYKEGQASVTYDPARVTPEDIVNAIEKLGYKASVMSKEGEQ